MSYELLMPERFAQLLKVKFKNKLFILVFLKRKNTRNRPYTI